MFVFDMITSFWNSAKSFWAGGAVRFRQFSAGTQTSNAAHQSSRNNRQFEGDPALLNGTSDTDNTCSMSDAERGRVRSIWLDRMLLRKGGWSDVDLEAHGGPSFNTTKR